MLLTGTTEVVELNFNVFERGLWKNFNPNENKCNEWTYMVPCNTIQFFRHREKHITNREKCYKNPKPLHEQMLEYYKIHKKICHDKKSLSLCFVFCSMIGSQTFFS